MKKTQLLILSLISLLFLTPPSVSAQYPNDSSAMGLNLTGISPYARQWTFINLVHHGIEWCTLDAASCWDRNKPESAIDANDYLKGGETGKMAVIWDLQDEAQDMSGDYVCTWDGTGKITFGTGTDGNGSGVTITSEQANKLEFSLAKTGTYFLILKVTENSVDNPISNIRLVEKEFENSTETFYPDFLEDWKYFKVLRYMDWMGTNHSPIVKWEDYPNENSLRQHKVSFKYMVDLANLYNAYPWFCVPLLADDDFIVNMATYIRDSLNPDLVTYIELSNEVWNGMFAQYTQAAQKARELGVENTGKDWEDAPAYFGYRSAQIHNIFDSVFALVDDAPFMVPITAWQNGNTWHVNKYVMPEYKGERKGGEAPLAHAMAPYFGNSLPSPTNASIVDDWSVVKVLDHIEFESHLSELSKKDKTTMPYEEQNLKSVKNELANWGVRDFIAYEGGQHISPTGDASNNTTLVDLMTAANRHERMFDIYMKYHDMCKEEGMGMFATFASIGAYSKYGSWGLKEYTWQTREQAPKYDATLTWAEQNPVVWDGPNMTWVEKIDEEAPAKPVNLTATEIAADYVLLTWDAANDNVGVVEYDIYKDAELLASTSNLTFKVQPLQPETAYNFYIIAKDEAGNTSEQSDILSVTTSVGTSAKLFYKNSLNVYPNPVKEGKLYISLDTEHGDFTIFDLNGKAHLSERISGKSPVDVSVLSKGVYFIEVNTDTWTKTAKLFVE